MLSNYDDEKRQELDRLNQTKVKRLKKTDANINWKRKKDRRDFHRRLCSFISDWESPFPDLRDIFNHDQIEWLFIEDVYKSKVPDPDFGNVTFIDFAIKAGYIDEFVVIKSGKPVLRRVTPIHHAGRNPECTREVVDSLFKIYNKFDRNYIDDEFGLTHFQVACMYGCVEAVEKFLELGQDPNLYPMAKFDATKSVDPPLHLALEHKHAKIVELLLKKGADPSLVNVNGLTPLHVVGQKADEDDDKFLELFFKICEENQRAVQIDARDKLGNTPLHLALIRGKKKVAELLLRKGANASLATEDGYSPLHLIGKYIDDDDLPEMFFKVCDELQLKVKVDARDKSGNTPLHLALANGRNKMIEWLLRHGADPSLATKDGYTPVFLICQMNRRQHVSVLDCEEKKEMAESLLRHGADPNAADEDGSTLLHILSQRSSDINLMKMFFEICEKTGRPLQVDARDELGNTPLHAAIRHDNKKSAELLLSRGADPNSRNKNRETPLLAICGNERGSLEMAKLLFEICDELHKSVDVNARDRWYRTPLSLALFHGDGELVELLLRRGADPNATDEDESTVLHLICRGEWDMRMAKLFFKICDELNLELDVDARDGLRRTPLNLAIKYDWWLVERLLRRGADPSATDEDGSTVLHLLCRKEYDTRTAKQFFKICDELNVELYVDARDNWRRTPLHLALTYDRVEMAEVLLRRGADPSLATNQGSTPLHMICQKKKDHHSAKIFFEICDELHKSVDVNAQDTSYRTPLSLALMYGDEELVKSLLRRGANPNAVDNRGLTVLHRICQRECNVEMAKLFFKICDELNLELDVDARDRLRRTPLNLAIKYDGWLVEWLLRRGANPNAADGGGSTAMHHICRGECDPRTAKLFFKICDELNLEVNFDDRGIRWTPLSPDLLCGEGELVESLLIRGADPNATDEDGSTLLHILSQRSSDIDLIKMFFEICEKTGRPLQVNARDNWRRTPLHLALTYGRVEMAEVLLRRGADPSLADAEGSTPLHFICERKKDYDSAKMFFEICDELHKSVDVNAQDRRDRTPLSLALFREDEKLVELLLKRGANPNAADCVGSTVLHLICRRKYDMRVARLLFVIADEKNQLVQVNRKDKWGRTPLQYAVANVFPEMIAILFDRGADLSSFVFPSADEFERYFEGELLRQNRDIEFELFMPLILEWLENRGYQLDRRGAFTIIRILAYMSVHAEKYWSLVDYPVNEELSHAAVERVKKYSHEPTPRRLRPYPRRHLYKTINMKAKPLRTQESMTRDPWISYGPPNLYTEEWINPVPWNYCGPPHLYTRSENNPEPWNFYESPNSTIRFVYRPVPSSSESRSSSESNKPPSTTSHYFDFNFWQLDSEESYEEYRGVVDELDAKRHPHETPRWRGFLLRWAAESVAELTRRLLPESCWERIAERLENVDLLNVCVAEKFHEWRADRRTRDRYAFRRMSVSRRQVWHDRRDLEDICRYPPPWRPEAYNRYYKNKKFI